MAHLRKYQGACCGALITFAATILGPMAGCGSSTSAQRPASEPSGASSGSQYKPGSRKLGDDEEGPADGLALQSEHGVLEAEDVDSVLERHLRTFTNCYSRAGGAERYIEGQVMLRIFVSGTGDVSDVHIIDNSLGNFAIERCLMVEARAIKFPAPRGGKATQFEYPLQFRSTREVALVDWPHETVPPEVIEAMDSMQPCEAMSAGPVDAIVYIEPSGAVGSAGFVSEAAIAPEAALCALEQIRGWRLQGQQGHVLRTRFTMRPPAIAPAHAPAASSRKSKQNRR